MEVLKPSRSSNIGVFEFWNIVLVEKKKKNQWVPTGYLIGSLGHSGS